MFVGVTLPDVNPSFTRGAGSWSFGIPSPSISSSDTSGVPSPSKSRWTTTGMVTLTVSFPFVMTTGILTVCSVSSPFHVKPVGVPVTLPLVPSIVKPFVGVGVTVVPGLFGLMTFSLLVYGCPSTALFVGFFSPAFSTSSTATSTSSLLPSGYTTSTVT